MDQIHEINLRNFEAHEKSKQYGVSSINNIIFLISTGTFVLSISFIGYVKTILLHPKLLVLSWVLLAIAIAGNVVSHIVTIELAKRNQDLINNPSTFEPYAPGSKDDRIIMNWSTIGRWAFSVVIVALAAGLLSLIVFGSVNLLHQNDLRTMHESY